MASLSPTLSCPVISTFDCNFFYATEQLGCETQLCHPNRDWAGFHGVRTAELEDLSSPRPPAESPKSPGLKVPGTMSFTSFWTSWLHRSTQELCRQWDGEIRQNRGLSLLWVLCPTVPLTLLLRCLTGISNMSSWSCLTNLLLLESSPSLLVATPAFQHLRHKILESSLAHLSFTPHLHYIRKYFWLYLQNVSRIQSLLTTSIVSTVVYGAVMNAVSYRIGLLAGMFASILSAFSLNTEASNPSQIMMNFNPDAYIISPLHWLPLPSLSSSITLSLTPLQLLRPLCCSGNMSGTFLPQGLYMCCSSELCLLSSLAQAHFVSQFAFKCHIFMSLYPKFSPHLYCIPLSSFLLSPLHLSLTYCIFYFFLQFVIHLR